MKSETKIYKQNTNKRKKNRPRQSYVRRSLQKYFWVYFMLAVYSWAWNLPWSVVSMASETQLQRTTFSFQWVPTVDRFLVRVGSPISFFLSTLGTSLAWTCIALMNLYAKQSYYVWRTTFFGAIHLPWLLQSFQLLFLIAPLAPRGEFDEKIPLNTECSNVS